MDDEERQQATSFGQIARDYDRYRPEPPEEALGWLLAPDVRSVAEIGAGTGLLTNRLVGRGLQVVAIEPDHRMREVLQDRVPQALIEAGRGESIPLGDGCVDAVVAASSWHWVEQSAGFAEAARVLRPGGTLGLLWTGPDRRVPWVRQFMAGGVVLSEAEHRRTRDERNKRYRPDIPTDAPFGPREIELFAAKKLVTLDELVGLLGTYPNTITSDGRTREDFLGDSIAFARTQLDFNDGRAELPIGCIAWRTTRD
jgi:SAM-dependent methyltransferase